MTLGNSLYGAYETTRRAYSDFNSGSPVVSCWPFGAVPQSNQQHQPRRVLTSASFMPIELSNILDSLNSNSTISVDDLKKGLNLFNSWMVALVIANQPISYWVNTIEPMLRFVKKSSDLIQFSKPIAFMLCKEERHGLALFLNLVWDVFKLCDSKDESLQKTSQSEIKKKFEFFENELGLPAKFLTFKY